MTNCFSLALLFFEAEVGRLLSGSHLCVSSETSHRNNLSHTREGMGKLNIKTQDMPF